MGILKTNGSQITEKPYTCIIRNLNFSWEIIGCPLKQESDISIFTVRSWTLAIVWWRNCRSTRDLLSRGSKGANAVIHRRKQECLDHENYFKSYLDCLWKSYYRASMLYKPYGSPGANRHISKVKYLILSQIGEISDPPKIVLLCQLIIKSSGQERI